MKGNFRRTQVAEIVGMDGYRIQFYLFQGVYDNPVRQGRGKPTMLTTRHLVETFLIKTLDEKGITLSTIKSILGQIRGYSKFKGYFTGDAIKARFSGKRAPRVYVTFFNESNEVHLTEVGRDDSMVPGFDMRGHKVAVVIDLTEAFVTVAQL